jgi:HEAT repeat protein
LSANGAETLSDIIDAPMYSDPPLPEPKRELLFPEKALPLWLKALARPEADMKRKAAAALVLAQSRGVKGLGVAVTPLLAELDRPEQPVMVRLAVAQALIALDARRSADSLFREAQASRGDMRELIEPALARWDHRPARVVWIDRLGKASTPRRDLVLAIKGLAAVGEEVAVGRLREMVRSDRLDGPLRLEAARALGALRRERLEKDARDLAEDGSARGIVARLAAATLLRRHDSKEAIALLQKLTRDREPSVAALAVARLVEIDTKLLVEALDHLLASADPVLRGFAVEVLFRQSTDRHVRLLGDRLDDLHPDVRVKARRALHALAAKKELRAQVIAQGERLLGGESWRGQQQAAVLLTQLDHKPAAPRLVELVRSARPEVLVTAAWGLRKLAVRATLAPVTSYVRDQVARKPIPGRQGLPRYYLDHQLSQLNQFLGQQKHREADGLLRLFIGGKGQGVDESRAAAIWALGLFHEGKTDAALAAALEARLTDTGSIPPEDSRVRRMSALALGRMKAKETLPVLRRYCPSRRPTVDMVSNACGWAIERITGERMPAPDTIRTVQRDWFLVPEE